ncbi:MAG: RNase adapter RapZ [Alphaproteobacteria bacterium]|nr:RNase adapter RapZ [Alphaproteobacteria bacterium]
MVQDNKGGEVNQEVNEGNARKPIIVTGMSGAGISTVLKTLEDRSFEVFDNFPLSLIPELCTQSQELEGKNNIAIGVDTRTRGFSPQCVLDVVKEIGGTLVFVTCDDSVLYKRFTETRRRHPMAAERTVSYGIEKERSMLIPLKNNADIVIDTSDKSIHDLRHMLEGIFSLKPEENLIISLVSFGFRNGVPREADIVMDVRFLRNPYWDPELRSKTGLEEDVGAYIREDGDFEPFFENFKTLLKPLFSRYRREGKSYLTIAVGCTGGKHRSVFTVDSLRRWMEEQGIRVFSEHRDIPR